MSDPRPVSRIGILSLAPTAERILDYDNIHMLTYARIIDAEREGHDWTSAAREILLLDVESDPEAAKACWISHLARAKRFVSAD